MAWPPPGYAYASNKAEQFICHCLLFNYTSLPYYHPREHFTHPQFKNPCLKSSKRSIYCDLKQAVMRGNALDAVRLSGQMAKNLGQWNFSDPKQNISKKFLTKQGSGKQNNKQQNVYGKVLRVYKLFLPLRTRTLKYNNRTLTWGWNRVVLLQDSHTLSKNIFHTFSIPNNKTSVPSFSFIFRKFYSLEHIVKKSAELSSVVKNKISRNRWLNFVYTNI